MQKGRLKQELDVLFETGSEISRRFGEEQEAREKAQEAWKKSGEEGDPPDLPASLDFRLPYQRWYTCALPLVKEAAPDRYAEFQAYYEQPNRYGAARTYTIQDYLVCYSAVDYKCVPWLEALRCFVNQLCIIQAASDRIEWRAIAVSLDHSQREEQLAELEAARQLMEFDARAATTIAGTILQRFLQALAKQHKLRFRKLSPPIREVAASLKAAQVLEDQVCNLCTGLAGIHERCLSPDFDPPTKVQARDLIDGTVWLLTNLF